MTRAVRVSMRRGPAHRHFPGGEGDSSQHTSEKLRMIHSSIHAMVVNTSKKHLLRIYLNWLIQKMANSLALLDWLRSFCSRLSIFLSYPSESRPIAEAIAQSLKDSGHRVFFDRDSLLPAGDFNAQIRKEIRNADRFVFMVSRSALENGRYTLAELELVRQRWASPVGRVLVVIIDPELKPNMLPPYFSGVQVITIFGNAPIEIGAAVERIGRTRPLCWACLALVAVIASSAVGIATGFIPNPFSPRVQIEIVPPEYVHFRPRARPPNEPNLPGADTDWIMAPVTITLPTNYIGNDASRNARPGQIVKEQVKLQIGKTSYTYSAASVVQIRGTSVAESISLCNGDWLCVSGNWVPVAVAPGAIVSREIMFVSNKPMSWKDFMDTVLAPDGPASAQVILKITIAGAAAAKQIECTADVADARAKLTAYFQPLQNPRPQVWEPSVACKA